MLCRGSQQRSRAQAGEDRRHDLTISFKDAVFGCSVDIDVDKMEGCAFQCLGFRVEGLELGTAKHVLARLFCSVLLLQPQHPGA